MDSPLGGLPNWSRLKPARRAPKCLSVFAHYAGPQAIAGLDRLLAGCLMSQLAGMEAAGWPDSFADTIGLRDNSNDHLTTF